MNYNDMLTDFDLATEQEFSDFPCDSCEYPCDGWDARCCCVLCHYYNEDPDCTDCDPWDI